MYNKIVIYKIYILRKYIGTKWIIILKQNRIVCSEKRLYVRSLLSLISGKLLSTPRCACSSTWRDHQNASLNERNGAPESV